MTQLLIDWSAGDKGALDEMIPLVYEELRRQADRALRAENAGHTLEATALVHEVDFSLVDQEWAQWQNRAQFFGMSANLMRRILIDKARSRLADKRGGGLRPITLQDVHAEAPENPADVLALTKPSNGSPRSTPSRPSWSSCAISPVSPLRRPRSHWACRRRR